MRIIPICKRILMSTAKPAEQLKEEGRQTVGGPSCRSSALSWRLVLLILRDPLPALIHELVRHRAEEHLVPALLAPRHFARRIWVRLVLRRVVARRDRRDLCDGAH